MTEMSSGSTQIIQALELMLNSSQDVKESVTTASQIVDQVDAFYEDLHKTSEENINLFK